MLTWTKFDAWLIGMALIFDCSHQTYAQQSEQMNTLAYQKLQGERAFQQHVVSQAKIIRARWLRTHGSLPSQDALPSITSAMILTSSVDVSVAPAEPGFSISHKAGSTAIQTFGLYYESDNTSQAAGISFENNFEPAPVANPTILQSPVGVYDIINDRRLPLGLYAAPGQWTIYSLYIIDQAGNQVSYTQSQIASIFKNKVSFDVVNKVSPDVTAPTFTTGKITFPIVKLNSKLHQFQATLNVQDDISGVSELYIGFSAPSGQEYFATDSLSAPVLSYRAPVFYTFQPDAETGTYTILSVTIRDVPGNTTYVTDPSTINQIFGTTTFSVAN